MLISASYSSGTKKIVKEVSAEWGDIEETGEDAGREENVLEDITWKRRGTGCFNLEVLTSAFLVIKNQKESQAQA